MVRTYHVYGQHSNEWYVPLGTVDAISGKAAIALAKLQFPHIASPVVFNREDYKEAKKAEYVLMKEEKNAIIREKIAEAA